MVKISGIIQILDKDPVCDKCMIIWEASILKIQR